MKLFDTSDEKNAWLLAIRNVTLEDVVFWIMHSELLDILEHPKKERYPNQQVFIVNMDDYAYIVPFVEDDTRVFLKTIIPNRKVTRNYLRAKSK